MDGRQPWTLVTVLTGTGNAHGERARVAVTRQGSGDARIPAFLAGYEHVGQVIADWEALLPQLRRYDGESGQRLARPRLLTPLRYPRKVLCSGPNFTDHLAEMGEAGLGETWTGYFFFKPPSTTLIGPTDDILVGPSWADDRVDWEGELAVILAEGGRDIPRHDAARHIAGFAVANDISLRGPHRRNTPAAPFVWDWVASKAADTSLPLGPGVVPAWHVSDPGELRITTTVNGTVKQDGTTADMVLDAAALVSDASHLLMLEPGDIILTGTPAGVGAGRGEFLSPGDVVEVTIPGIGTLRNAVRLRTATTEERTG